MAGNTEGARKFAARKLKEDPNYFKKLSAKVKKPRGGKASSGSFKRGNPFAALGGKASKRRKVDGHIDLAVNENLPEDYQLDFLETEE